MQVTGLNRAVAKVLAAALTFGVLSLDAIGSEAASFETIASSSAWQKLLHYQPDDDGLRSSVLDSEFFLAADGRSNPLAELEATLAALRSTTGNQPAAACVFPARAIFLANALDEHFPTRQCPELIAFSNKYPLEGVSFVYAAGRLDHPASVFGHGFLRLNIAGDQDPILDPVLNFTAQTGDDSTLKYMAIGLVGGYVGKFSTPPYYELVERHNRRELRDLWEYPILLSASQLQLLVAHFWEIRDKSFDYLFISENCVTQILALLEAVEPSLPVMSFERGKVMPIQMLNGFQRHSYLLGEPKHRSSLIRQIDFREQYLSSQERRLVREMADGGEFPASFELHNIDRQAAILDTAHDLVVYRARNQEREVDRDLVNRLLSERTKLDTQVDWPKTPLPTRQPAGAHGSARGSISLLSVQDQPAMQLGWRFVYHDLLDPVSANPWGTEVESWNVVVEAQGSDYRVKQVDIVNIANYARRGALLKQPSFRTQIGLRETLGANHSEFAIDRATGASWGRQPWFAYAMLQTDAAAGRGLDRGWRLGLGIRGGVYFNPRPEWAMHFHTVNTRGLAGDTSIHSSWQLEQQWSFSQHFGMRLSLGENRRWGDGGFADSPEVREQFQKLSFLVYW